MRILIVADTLLTGGAEWFLLRMFTHLKSINIDTNLFVTRPDCIDKRLIANFPNLTYSNPPLIFLRLAVLADRIIIRFISKSWFVDQVNRIFLRLTIRNWQPNVVHSHLLQADYKAFLATIGLNTTHLVTMHGDYIEIIKQGQSQNLKKIQSVLKAAKCIIVISEEQKSVLESHMPEVAGKILKIYNGYPERHLPYKCKKDVFVFGMIARGLPQKGWRVAIEAFMKLNRRDAQLVLYGESEYLNQLRLEFDNPAIIFMGYTNNPLEAVQKFDVGLFPSYFAAESLPTTLIEYLMLGKPVICTSVGECSKMIEFNGEFAGITLPLVHGKPDSTDLSKAMLKFMEEDFFYSKCSVLAKLAYKKFDMNNSMEKYIRLYLGITYLDNKI